ncbi:MAG: glycoside hydrolase family 127 protein [Bacteroidales bacterium]|nr:glycoside hydrolase family 127 protein [Bacteroidales bacterium]
MLSVFLSIVVGGLLGHAVDAGYNGRLFHYINSPQSEAIALFSPEVVRQGKGGWRGEHAGKWMYAASRAYERTGDGQLRANLVSVADYLVSLQEEDGYLGCYREDKRFYHRPEPEAMVVDWDTWIIAYLIKGFAETTVATGDPKYADCALRLAEFLHWTVFDQGIKIAQTGMHSGMAGCGMLDPLCDLYRLRPEPKVRALIDECIKEMDETPCLQLISLLGRDYDVSLIGNGKIYEMNRCLTGLAKAYQLFGDERLLKACLNGWESIRSAHLTTLGGPWGGINCCYELFNRPAEWAPYEITETCSFMEWMHFTWEMLRITGEGKYASELEKTSYNALMAARAEDGDRWIYYVRTNGEFGPGADWSCCWSSGMTALEDVPVYMYETRKAGVFVNIISESAVSLPVKGGTVTLEQTSDYAHTGVAEFVIGEGPGTGAMPKGAWTLAVHQPEWASSYAVKVNGKAVKAVLKDGYITVRRAWKAGDRVTLEFPYEIRTLERSWEYSNAGSREHNFSNWYNGFTKHYVTFCAGPLVFATDHLDRFADRHPIPLTRDEIAAATLVRGTEVSDLTLRAGDTILKPICQMPAYEGPQSRFIWFQIR